MRNIVLLGAGGHCKSCIEIIENLEKYKIKGIVDKSVKAEQDFMGYKILGSDKEIKELVYKDKKKSTKMNDDSINKEIYFFDGHVNSGNSEETFRHLI